MYLGSYSVAFSILGGGFVIASVTFAIEKVAMAFLKRRESLRQKFKARMK